MSLLRLKKIDDAFLKRYMQIPRWKNLVKLLVVVVEMFCYIICVAYIFVTATLAHNRYILLAFSVALVFQFMFIDNFRIFWKIQSSLGYINVLKSLEGELKKERDGTTPLVEIVTQEQKKDTSSRRMLLRSGDLSAAQQKLFQAERRLDYTLLAYLSFYCPVNQ